MPQLNASALSTAAHSATLRRRNAVQFKRSADRFIFRMPLASAKGGPSAAKTGGAVLYCHVGVPSRGSQAENPLENPESARKPGTNPDENPDGNPDQNPGQYPGTAGFCM